ncbi:MAG TPA: hypothetical protein VGJ78_08495 [Vicinamibacterales bacterium]|jgi:hypothetical protein
MPPVVLIIEARKEVAAALEAAIQTSNFTPVTVPYLERLTDIPHPIAAIVVRVAFEGVGEPPHAAIEKLPRNRPPVVAIAWEDKELAEAHRLKCDVVLHAPHDITRLCETLMKLVGT